MANSSVFRIDTPDGADDPREGDDRIREIKAAMKERMLNAGIFIDNETDDAPDADAGMMIPGLQGGLSGATNTPGANDLVFLETDKATDMAIFNDSGKTLTLGTGRGGANDYSMVAETGKFADLDINGSAITALPSKSIVGVYQASSNVALVLSTAYQALDETITFTTAAAAGDVLVTWTGAYHYNGAADTDDAHITFEIRRDSVQIFEAATKIRLINAAASGEHIIPVTLQWLDTGASNATSTKYDVRVKHVISGTPTISSIWTATRVLTCQEFIFN